MDISAWQQAAEEEGEGTLLLLGVPALLRSGTRTELVEQRAAIVSALVSSPAEGLSGQELKGWVWGHNVKVTDANVSNHVRKLRAELDAQDVPIVFETPKDNPARRFRLIRPCDVDLVAFRRELELAAGFWSEADIRSTWEQAADAISFWAEPRALITARGRSLRLDEVIHEAEAMLRRAAWLLARTSFIQGEWRGGTETLNWVRAVDEHSLDEALCAAHIVGLRRTAGEATAREVMARFRIGQDMADIDLPRLESSLAAESAADAERSLAAYDQDFGLPTPEVDLRDAPEPAVLAPLEEIASVAPAGGLSVGARRSSEASDVAAPLEAEPAADLREHGSLGPPRASGHQAPAKGQNPMVWLWLLAFLALGLGIVVYFVLSTNDTPAERDKNNGVSASEDLDLTLLSIDFSEPDEPSRWTVAEQLVGDEYLTGVTTSAAVAEVTSARGSSLQLVANPDSLEAKSHHLIVGRWVPGRPEVGQYEVSVSFFLPEASAELTQTGPEVSVQITTDGRTIEAAVQAVPNPWVLDLNIWSGGEVWRPVEAGSYRPVPGEWVDLTLGFDTGSMSYDFLTIGTADGTPSRYDLSSELLVEVDKTPDPSAEDFADGLVVALEAENLWSSEQNPLAARAEVYYDDVRLELIRP